MNDMVVGSLGQVALSGKISIAEAFVDASGVVIVDTSSSMSAGDTSSGDTRYSVACSELRSLQGNLPGKIVVLGFSSDVNFYPDGIPAYLGGGTNLGGALTFAKIADLPGMRFVVISDGEPQDEDGAIAVASGYTNRIDTIYVGSEVGFRGRDFLERLSRVSGGVNVSPGVSGISMLEETVSTLLLGTA